MNKIVIGLGIAFILGAVFVPSVFGLGSFGGAPTLSVAQGNVYDVYGTNANGQTLLIASCVSFDAYLSLAANPAYPGGVSAIPDSACGPITLVTSTVVQSTTFTNAITTCPPLLPGYSIICNNTTYTNTATTTRTITVNSTTTSTQTSTALTTTSLTITQSGTTTQTTATAACKGYCLPKNVNGSPNYGEILGVLIVVVGAVYKKRG